MFIPVFPPPFSPFSKNRLIYNCCSVPRFCQDRGTFQNTNKSRELGTFQDFSRWNLLKSNVDFRKCLPRRAESNLVPMNGKNVFFKLFKADLVISCAKDNIFCLLLPSAKDVWCHIMKRALFRAKPFWCFLRMSGIVFFQYCICLPARLGWYDIPGMY